MKMQCDASLFISWCFYIWSHVAWGEETSERSKLRWIWEAARISGFVVVLQQMMTYGWSSCRNEADVAFQKHILHNDKLMSLSPSVTQTASANQMPPVSSLFIENIWTYGDRERVHISRGFVMSIFNLFLLRSTQAWDLATDWDVLRYCETCESFPWRRWLPAHSHMANQTADLLRVPPLLQFASRLNITHTHDMWWCVVRRASWLWCSSCKTCCLFTVRLKRIISRRIGFFFIKFSPRTVNAVKELEWTMVRVRVWVNLFSHEWKISFYHSQPELCDTKRQQMMCHFT